MLEIQLASFFVWHCAREGRLPLFRDVFFQWLQAGQFLDTKSGNQSQNKKGTEWQRCFSAHVKPSNAQDRRGHQRTQGGHQQLYGDPGDADPNGGRGEQLDVAEPQSLILSQTKEKPSQKPYGHAGRDALDAGDNRRCQTLEQGNPGKTRGRNRNVEPVWNDAAAQIDPGEQCACDNEHSEESSVDHVHFIKDWLSRPPYYSKKPRRDGRARSRQRPRHSETDCAVAELNAGARP